MARDKVNIQFIADTSTLVSGINMSSTAMRGFTTTVASANLNLKAMGASGKAAFDMTAASAQGASRKVGNSYQKMLKDGKKTKRSIDPITGAYQNLGTKGKSALDNINGSMIKLLRGRAGLVVLGLIAKQVFDVLIGGALRSAKEAAKLAATVETLALQIKTLTLATSQEAFFPASTQQDIMDLGVAFGETFEAVGKARYDVVSAGFIEVADSVKVLDASLKLGIAGVTDAATATKLLVGVMKAYGAEADEASKYSDILFATVQKGITTIPELSGSLGKASAIASIAKVPFEEVGAAMAVMTQKGLQTAEATTALRALLKALVDSSSTAGKELRAMGVDLESGLGGALISVSQASGDSAEKLKAMFGNIRAFTAAASIGTDGAKEFYAALDHIKRASGVAEKAQELLVDSIERQTKRIEAAEKRLEVIGGRGYAQQMSQSADGVIESFESMSGVVNATGQHSGAVLAKLSLEWKKFMVEIKPAAAVLGATFGTLALGIVEVARVMLIPLNDTIRAMSWLGEKIGLIEPPMASMKIQTDEMTAGLALLKAKFAELIMPLRDLEGNLIKVDLVVKKWSPEWKMEQTTAAFEAGKLSVYRYVQIMQRLQGQIDNTDFDRMAEDVKSADRAMKNAARSAESLTVAMADARLKQLNKVASDYVGIMEEMSKDEYIDYWTYKLRSLDSYKEALESLSTLPALAPEDELFDPVETLEPLTEAQIKQNELWIKNRKAAEEWAKTVQRAGDQAINLIGDRVGSAIGSAITGAKSMQEAFSEMSKAIVVDLTRIIAKMLIIRVLSGIFSGGGSEAMGGWGGAAVPLAARGGVVNMANGGTIIPNIGQAGIDSVPVMAQAGEGFLTRNTMQRLERFLASSESASAMGANSLSGGGQPMMVNFNIARPQSASDSVSMARTVGRMTREFNRRVM